MSITLGIHVDGALKKKVKFLDDPSISVKEVNTTCERCLVLDCAERAAPPSEVGAKNQRRRVQNVLQKLEEENG